MPNQVQSPSHAYLYVRAETRYDLSFHSQDKLCIVLGTVHCVLAPFTDGQLYICAWSGSILCYRVI